MSETLRVSSRLFLNMAIFVTVSLFYAPKPVIAETMAFIITPDKGLIGQDSPKVTSINKLRLDLDEDGNVMIRHGKVSVTFIYEDGNGSQENRIQSGNSASRKEVACLGGLSVKLGVTF
ncbi:MAG: hypothetical protein WA140_10890 [Geobacteraceae bacterium]